MSSTPSVFSTNCSLPTDTYHFVSSPNIRGTIDILWSSISTIILCTWSIQHLVVPPQRRTGTWNQKLRKIASSTLHKIGWMVITILAPELLNGKALMDWASAHRSASRMSEKYAPLDNVPWTVTHGFFANLGGFVIKFAPQTPSSTLMKSSIQQEPKIVNPSQIKLSTVGPIPEQLRPHTSALEPMDIVSLQQSTKSSSQDASHSQNTIPRDNRHDLQRPTLSSSPDAADSHNSTPQDSGHDTLQRNSSQEAIEAAAGSKSQPSLSSYTSDIENQGRESRGGLVHKIGTSANCPCRSRRLRNPEIQYMHIDNILSHRQAFWNGPFYIDPSTYRLIEDHPMANNLDLATNRDIASLALFKFAKQPGTKSANLQNYAQRITRLSGSVWALDSHQLYLARELGIIASLPSISEDELNDQSKGNFIVKALAILQVIYIIIQLILRHTDNLSSSQLEVATVAFACCSLVTYALCLSKPQNVGTPRYIEASRYPTPDEMLLLTLSGPMRPIYWSLERRRYSIPNLSVHGLEDSKRVHYLFNMGCVLGSTIFGAVHCAAWNFHFPSTAELWIWRAASACMVAIPLSSGYFSLRRRVLTIYQKRKGIPINTAFGLVSTMVILILLCTYVIARLVLLVEIFRTLCFLPPEAFKTASWASAIPHIS